MDRKRWDQINEAFFFVTARGQDRVGDALQDVCAGDDDLLQTVRRMVDEHFRLVDAGRSVAPSHEQHVEHEVIANRFRVRAHLGAGTFGDVYRVLDEAKQVDVALKILRVPDPVALYHFKREIRLLAEKNIRHDNIIVLHDLIADRDRWMFSMEFVDGVDLLRFVDGRPLADRDAALRSCIVQLADGLLALHQLKLVHRDLKPSNVLVTAAGRVKLLDFGLARAFGDEAQASMTFAGTPDYMSPEQAAGAPLGEPSDWYALGVILYQALTGVLPFRGGLLEVLRRKQVENPIAPTDIVPHVPAPLGDLCMRLLERDPLQRASYADVASLLHPSSAVPLREPDRRVFVGRARSLEELCEAYAAATDKPVLVHLTGPSGIGKSVLVREFLKRLGDRDSPPLVFAGRCYEGESVPYQALDDLVDHLSQYLRQLPKERVEGLLPRNFAVLARMFPVLAQFRFDVATPVRHLDSTELRTRAFGALREMLGRFAERHRVVLAIDDLQWGDMDGCAALDDLLSSDDSPPVLVLLAYRSEDIDASTWIAPLRDTARHRAIARTIFIELDRLESSDAEQLAKSLLGRPVDQATLNSIVLQSAGNPFLVHEIARWINARGVGLALAAPFSVDDVVRTRLCDLDAESGRFLELVAIGGQPTELSVVQAAGGFDDLFAARDRLIGDRLIRSRMVQGREEVEVYHDRIRATILADAGAAVLVARHRELGQALESAGAQDPERIATHFEHAHELQRCSRYALQAARRAVAALAFNRAARFFELALTTQALDHDDRRSAYRGLADALANAGRGAESARAYLDAVAIADKNDRIALTSQAASQLLRCGYVREGIELLDQLLRETAQKLPRHRLLLLGHVGALRARIRLRGLRFHERPPDQISPDDRLRLDLYWAGAMGTTTIDPVRSAAFLARHLLLALESGDPYRISLGLAAEAVSGRVPSEGTYRKGHQLLADAAALAERIGNPHAKAFATLMRAALGYAHGDWEGAAVQGDEAVETLRSECVNVAWELSLANILTFVCRSVRGDWAENRRRLPGLIRDAEARGDINATLSLRILGCAYILDVAADRPDDALRQLHKDVASWSHEQYDLHKGNALVGEIEIALYADEPARAWKKIQEEWPQYAAFRMPAAAHAFARCGRGRAAIALAGSSETGDDRRKQLIAVAEADAHALRRNGPPWSRGLAGLLQSGVATLRADRGLAYRLLIEAERALERADMRPFHMAARYRRASFEPVVERARVRQVVVDWAERQEIVRLDRIVATLAPGLYPE